MNYVECSDCGSVIKSDFKDCPYCDVQVGNGGFRHFLNALTGNAAIYTTRKSASVLAQSD